MSVKSLPALLTGIAALIVALCTAWKTLPFSQSIETVATVVSDGISLDSLQNIKIARLEIELDSLRNRREFTATNPQLAGKMAETEAQLPKYSLPARKALRAMVPTKTAVGK